MDNNHPEGRGNRQMSSSLGGRGVLVCEECGQRVVIEKPLSAWRPGSTPPGCECGERTARGERRGEQGKGEAGSVTNPLAQPGHSRPGSPLR